MWGRRCFCSKKLEVTTLVNHTMEGCGDWCDTISMLLTLMEPLANLVDAPPCHSVAATEAVETVKDTLKDIVPSLDNRTYLFNGGDYGEPPSKGGKSSLQT